MLWRRNNKIFTIIYSENSSQDAQSKALIARLFLWEALKNPFLCEIKDHYKGK